MPSESIIHKKALLSGSGHVLEVDSMHAEYDLSNMQSRRNPFSSKLKKQAAMPNIRLVSGCSG